MLTATSYDRFFDLVGNDSVNYNTKYARTESRAAYVASCMTLVEDIPDTYENVAEELEALALQFWEHVHSKKNPHKRGERVSAFRTVSKS